MTSSAIRTLLILDSSWTGPVDRQKDKDTDIRQKSGKTDSWAAIIYNNWSFNLAATMMHQGVEK